MPQLKVIRTLFQDFQSRLDSTEHSPKLILVLDMEGQIDLSTNDIPDLASKLELALPGIFPDDSSPVAHSCGGNGSGIEKHTFREEIEAGTNIPHLLEHVVMHLMSRRCNHGTAYCGQRSIDLEKGILTHYYIVLDYPSKLEAIVAADLGFQLVSSWLHGRTVQIDPGVVLDGIRAIIEPMITKAA